MRRATGQRCAGKDDAPPAASGSERNRMALLSKQLRWRHMQALAQGPADGSTRRVPDSRERVRGQSVEGDLSSRRSVVDARIHEAQYAAVPTARALQITTPV